MRLLTILTVILSLCLVASCAGAGTVTSKPLNILLITVDDMNRDSVGAYGSPISNITANLDQLAAEGVRFNRAYVAASNCSPSRVAIQTGLYPQQSGATGFFYIQDDGVPSLPVELRKAGYMSGIVNKISDTNPGPDSDKYWDFEGRPAGALRYSPEAFAAQSAAFLEQANSAGAPFYFVVNISDPHKPNFNDREATRMGADQFVPSRLISPDEVVVPDFLPDLPGIRSDLLNYYNSVRRADDTVGAVLGALEDSALSDNTLVIFLSDHGMPFPFAKSSVYENGLGVPLIMKWQGEIVGGSEDDRIVSVIDLMPSILEAAGLTLPTGQEYLGKSLWADEEATDGAGSFKYAFGGFDENAKGYPVPMRSVIDRDWVYVFNAWADGTHQIRSAAMNHRTFRIMERRARDDEAIAERVEFYKFRTVEELCHLATDPGCTTNLAGLPEHAETLARLQARMRSQMVQTGDYLLEAFDMRDDRASLKAFMDGIHQGALERASRYKWKRAETIAGSAAGNTELYQHAVGAGYGDE